jgi:hypothetical protein
MDLYVYKPSESYLREVAETKKQNETTLNQHDDKSVSQYQIVEGTAR